MPHDPTQLVMPFAPATSFAAADYVRGEANNLALSWIERWPDWPYSIALIHGDKASGKTHLAHVFAARTGATFIPYQRLGQAPADVLLAGNHAWVLDDVDLVADEAALAQLINHARARGDYMLLLANADAAKLPFRLPDLRSRLTMLPQLALGLPDDALLKGVLAKEFADRQLRISPELLDYAIIHLERSFEALQRFAAQMDQISLSRGRAITMPLMREVLK